MPLFRATMQIWRSVSAELYEGHWEHRKDTIIAMKAIHWMYIGCGTIAVSSMLQIFGTAWPALSILNIVSAAIIIASIPATIMQTHKSTAETQQQFDQERAERDAGDQRVFETTEPGRAHIAKQKLLHDMRKAEQEGQQ